MQYFAYGLMAYLVIMFLINLNWHDRRQPIEVHAVNTRTGLVALVLFTALVITLLVVS